MSKTFPRLPEHGQRKHIGALIRETAGMADRDIAKWGQQAESLYLRKPDDNCYPSPIYEMRGVTHSDWGVGLLGDGGVHSQYSPCASALALIAEPHSRWLRLFNNLDPRLGSDHGVAGRSELHGATNMSQGFSSCAGMLMMVPHWRRHLVFQSIIYSLE